MNKPGPGPHQGVAAPQLVFALYVFGPAILFFFLPLLFFRVPLLVFLNDDRLTVVSARFVAIAVAVCLVWFAIAVGIVVWPSRAARTAGTREWTPRALWVVFVAFSIMGSAVSLVHDFRALPAGIEEIVHQAFLAPPIGFVLGVYLLRRHLARGRAAAVWALMILDLVVSVLVPVLLTKVAPAALSAVAILYGLTASGVSWRRQAAAALLLLPFVFIAFPLKEYLRMQYYGLDPFHRGGQAVVSSPTSSSPPVRMTFAARLAAYDPWVIGMRFHRAGGPFLIPQFGAVRVLQRINRLSDLAYVVAMTPATVPFARGVTYAPLLSKLVPRFIWPNKPREIAGQFYGHRYPFLDPPDTVHSANLPMVTEGWVNAGWAGVLISAAAVGLLLRLAWTFGIGPSGAPGNVLIGMAVVGTAVDGDSNLSLVMGGMFHALLVYGVIAGAIGWWGGTSAQETTAAAALTMSRSRSR